MTKRARGFDIFGNCPACDAKWGYTHDGERYSRVIGVEIVGQYDGVSRWQCPDCEAEWDRFTGKRIETRSAK